MLHLINNNNNKRRTAHITPSWERRLNKKIEGLRADLARMLEYKRGNRNRRLTRKVNEIKNKYKQHTKKNSPNTSTDQLIDTIRQRLAILSKRMKQYKKSNARKSDNYLFTNNQKAFYNKINEDNNIELTEPPTKEEIETFWGEIWSNSVTYNNEANFMHLINEEAVRINDMACSQITEETLTSQMSKIHNWKSPGPDKIHNFWLKKLTSMHPKLLEIFNNILDNPQNLPDKICEGVTYLKPKNPNTKNPAHYRPITCLNTIYKLLTGCITQIVTKHCENQQIIAEEQKGSRIGTLGCKEQLTIDPIIMNQAHKKKRNLFTCFIDYIKAYDKIPHSWIIHSLKLYKINNKVINLLQNAMTKWKTTVQLKTPKEDLKTGKISIKRGIYQGDSLSSLLFCLSMNSLSSILKHNNKGFTIKTKEQKHTITHLFYMDDLKLYADSERNLINIIKIVEKFSIDINMELGTEKCKIQAIKKGQIITTRQPI
ncbi:uncharacterized protein LOC116167068 [Photinus pyralis]|uniref:uncharacterized protein LOC116167068 n=1 Tax=Photinus pyralis TaxID=7054 RepID=UPI0012670AD7|nr:uncharacterized protein LOC116167068 [Photinus pyralis]